MNILTSVLAGIGIGVFFYAGLWFTIQRLITTRHPVLLTVASFGGRTIVTLGAFLFIAESGWKNALGALAGFGVGRVLAAGLSRKGGQPRCT